MFRCIRLAVVVLGVLPACGPRYDCSQLATPGTRPVATRQLDVPDAARALSVSVRLTAPERPDTQTRLILFSTGLGPETHDFDDIAHMLAASNYAVAVIAHPASDARRVCGHLRGNDCWHALEETETHPEVWDDRFSDMSLLMDRLPGLLGVDGTHIGLVGHSFGAFTVMVMSGTTYVDPRTNERRDRRDPRVVSAVAMSPQGPRWFGLDAQSWDHIDRPLFVLTGDKDGSDYRPDDSPEWRREPFTHMTGGDKLQLRIVEGEHMSFTSREKRHAMSELIQRSTLAFLDDTMRHPSKGISLTAEAVKSCSHGHASLEAR